MPQEVRNERRLKSASIDISASDWLRPDRTPIRGNTVCLYLSGGNLQELKDLFRRLSEDAESERSAQRDILWHLRRTKRQVRGPLDVRWKKRVREFRGRSPQECSKKSGGRLREPGTGVRSKI